MNMTGSSASFPMNVFPCLDLKKKGVCLINAVRSLNDLEWNVYNPGSAKCPMIVFIPFPSSQCQDGHDNFEVRTEDSDCAGPGAPESPFLTFHR